MTKTPRTDAELKLEAFMDWFGIVETIQVEFARQLETELADKDQQLVEARAEIKRLKQLWSCNLDIIGGELNKQLAEAQAEIEKQDTLLEKCLSLLKQQKKGGGRMMSDTPRTDEQLKLEAFFDGIGIVETVEVEFAQQLETELAEARAEIARKDALIERMKNCQNCGRTGGFCRHCRYAADKRGWDDNWKEPI